MGWLFAWLWLVVVVAVAVGLAICHSNRHFWKGVGAMLLYVLFIFLTVRAVATILGG